LILLEGKQTAILKVLVSHPEGRATIAALNSDLSILNTSGSDYRLRRLAARAPGLDIFGQRLVLRLRKARGAFWPLAGG
jgi:hypothetical protein